MTTRLPHRVFISLTLLGALCISGCGQRERNNILILVPTGNAASKAIAEDYAAARRIPETQILGLSLSGENAGGEINWEGFQSQIAAPLEAFLAREDPDHTINMLITTPQWPIRIGHCDATQSDYPRRCDSSSVDAALAGLGRLQRAQSEHGSLELNPNPFFADTRTFNEFRRDEPNAKLRFLVARLTGAPAAKTHDLEDTNTFGRALRRFLGATTSEAVSKSIRWKIRALTPPSSRDPAVAALLNPVREALAQRGIRVCDDCSSAEEPNPYGGIILQQGFDAAAPLTFPGLVIALGQQGTSLKAFDHFVDTWVAKGAGALSLHLGDPSLGGVSRPAIQIRAWLDGRPAIEAHFKSVPHLGWTNIFIGDPFLAIDEVDLFVATDRDGDGIEDQDDNCLEVSNADQRDSNGDGFGNRCDPDVDNDGRVDTSWGTIYPVDTRGDLEFIALTAINGPYNPDHDLDGDGVVDHRDLALAQLWLFRSPGPSGRQGP